MSTWQRQILPPRGHAPRPQFICQKMTTSKSTTIRYRKPMLFSRHVEGWGLCCAGLEGQGNQRLIQHVHLESCPHQEFKRLHTHALLPDSLLTWGKLPFLALVLSQVGWTTELQPAFINTSHLASLSASFGSMKHVLYSLDPDALLESRVQPATKWTLYWDENAWRETELAVAVACSYLKVLHKKEKHATAQNWQREPGKASDQEQVWAFLFRRKSRETETEGKKALSSLYKHLFT